MSVVSQAKFLVVIEKSHEDLRGFVFTGVCKVVVETLGGKCTSFVDSWILLNAYL